MTLAETISLRAGSVPDRASTMPLSVILPNFNHGALIPRALNALLSQTPAAKEIIVVDDGSTDDSVKVIEEFRRRYGAIKLIRNASNRGIIDSVKSALQIATGEYLLFASADDFVLPGLFGRAFAALTENPDAAFFCAGVALLDADNRVIGLRPVTAPRRERGCLSPLDVRRVIRTTDFWVLGTSTVYRRQLLAEIGYFDARLGTLGDVLANRLLAFRHGFYFDPAVLAAYNKDPMSFSARNALSVKESRRFLDEAAAWIADNLPADVRDEHGRLFDRRMRFGLARLWIIWRNGRLDANAIADILNFGGFDRAMLAALSRAPFGSGVLALGWMTLRMPPFSPAALATAWGRALYFRWFRRAAVQRQVDTIAGSAGGGDLNSSWPAGEHG
jgi:glycosyltransferase involved in cell wall biosynthesis